VILHLLGLLLEIYLFIMIARALMSWFGSSTSPIYRKVNAILIALTEPVLRPIQKILPPIRVGGSYIDLSILVFFVVVQFLVLPLLLR
jgi:YggT family protein